MNSLTLAKSRKRWFDVFICGSLEHKRRDCPEKYQNKQQAIATRKKRFVFISD